MEEVFGNKIANCHYRYRKGVYAVTLLENKVIWEFITVMVIIFCLEEAWKWENLI